MNGQNLQKNIPNIFNNYFFMTKKIEINNT